MEVSLIYPHQLFADSPVLDFDRLVYLVEEPLLLTHNAIHRQRLMLHKLSMDAYQVQLETAGYKVKRLHIQDHPQTTDVFKRLEKDSVTQIHVIDTTDQYLERALTHSGLKRIWYESPMFILEKADAQQRFVESKRFMAAFYKKLRQDAGILVDEEGKPTGGKWSFDEDNRQKIPKGTTLPADISFIETPDIAAAAEWTTTVDAEAYGETNWWLPYTHADAQIFLKEFLHTRFETFGPYEDAITTKGTRLWHSTLSPLLNVGLLTPKEVLDEAIKYAQENDVPLNSLEGFVRQILGWREFIRASYEVDGNSMRQQNFWQHTKPLSESLWSGTTNIPPVDHAVKTALAYGYTHHIERLMVMGNFLLLTQTHPEQVYRWFMGMYVDAYDWVMVPNVYAMSQFSDGGSFATKPYISGANYIKKMSDFPTGDWEKTWTALYWNFIHTHVNVFENNYRLSMMPRILGKMTEEIRNGHLQRAQDYLTTSD